MQDGNENAKQRLIAELEWELKWQWKWEKMNRQLGATITWLSWLSNLLILALAFWQLQLGEDVQKWVILAITLLVMLSLSLPLLGMNFRFQARQEVHDKMARAYSILKMKLEMEAISLDEAIAVFEQIHGQPTEKLIRYAKAPTSDF